MFEIFSDRMEFTFYGGLIQGQSEENFFSCSSMPRNRELMGIFKKEPDITAKQLSEKVGFSTRKISCLIKELGESGKITRIGSDRKGYWIINK